MSKSDIRKSRAVEWNAINHVSHSRSLVVPKLTNSYSGHGTKIRDDDYKEEEDGYDEALVPLDYQEKGMIRDDE